MLVKEEGQAMQELDNFLTELENKSRPSTLKKPLEPGLGSILAGFETFDPKKQAAIDEDRELAKVREGLKDVSLDELLLNLDNLTEPEKPAIPVNSREDDVIDQMISDVLREGSYTGFPTAVPKPAPQPAATRAEALDDLLDQLDVGNAKPTPATKKVEVDGDLNNLLEELEFGESSQPNSHPSAGQSHLLSSSEEEAIKSARQKEEMNALLDALVVDSSLESLAGPTTISPYQAMEERRRLQQQATTANLPMNFSAPNSFDAW